jgi:tetratricopeptide (TPR) repeat protein
MKFVTQLLLVFLILCFLVVDFVVQNNEVVKLRYKIPFTSIQFPSVPQPVEGEELEAEAGEPTYDIHVVSLILISILIGIAIMTVFVAIAGIGWRWYVLTNNSRIRKERRKLWDDRERAIALSLMGFEDATEEFEDIIDKENPHVELYVGLAESYERKGDYQKAIENYNAVLAQHPKNYRALFGAARNWEALKNYNEAIKLYERVLKLEPTSPTARQKVRE